MPAEASQLSAVQDELQLLHERGALWLALLRRPASDVAAFTAASYAASMRLRTLLAQRAREPQEFRALLRRLSSTCERLAQRAEAAGVTLPATRIDTLRRSLEALLQQPQPTGHHLLPLIPQIEDLVSLLNSTGLQPYGALRARPTTEGKTSSGGARQTHTNEPRTAAAKMCSALRRLSAQLAAEQFKKVKLKIRGFAELPIEWHGNVFDMSTQLLRNAIEHGIELPAERLAANKSEVGTIEIAFASAGNEAWELQVRDDGAGVNTDELVRIAAERGLLRSDAKLKEDPRHAVGLIFLRGLTTAKVAEGRGNGMQIVREQVKRLGGRTQVGTRVGQFTRIRIQLPKATQSAGAAAPALPPRHTATNVI
jgi:signal transduction histidine kinase